jgi:hypothetical protein
MSNYIEFTTTHNERTFGNPVHDGQRPRRYRDVQGIRVDGEPVEFIDETIPDRVQRYFAESRKLRRRRIANDCVAFVALMNSVALENKSHNPFKDFDLSASIESPVENLDDTTPLVLVQGFHDGLRLARHIILPAHITDEENYLHKLGDKGPLCMSDLHDAKRIMGCTSAHPVIDAS